MKSCIAVSICDCVAPTPKSFVPPKTTISVTVAWSLFGNLVLLIYSNISIKGTEIQKPATPSIASTSVALRYIAVPLG